MNKEMRKEGIIGAPTSSSCYTSYKIAVKSFPESFIMLFHTVFQTRVGLQTSFDMFTLNSHQLMMKGTMNVS